MKNINSVVIAIPIYKEALDQDELFSIDRTFKILGKYSTKFFGPEGLCLDFYRNRYPEASYVTFPKEYFASTKAYSSLLVKKEFYDEFEAHEFILIVQPDVYVFRDDLPNWISTPFDYVGAPWPQGLTLNLKIGRFASVDNGKTMTVYVGNGGFSLRRTKKCIRLIEENKEIANWFEISGSNEDLFFSFIGSLAHDFIIPNQVQASVFSMEIDPKHLCQINGGKMPMAVHAYKKIAPDFWSQIIEG